MIVSLLVAMDERRGIGRHGRLPWRLSSDLKRFRQLTMGHHIVVGRKTFESIGKPLAGRQMIIVTRDPDYHVAGCFMVHSIAEASGRACSGLPPHASDAARHKIGRSLFPPAAANGPRAAALCPSERSGKRNFRPVLDNRSVGRLV